MEQTKITAVGSVLAAIVASLCCIGPVVVALIGVGSIGAFTAFEAFRPYLIGLTTIFLGFAFYLTYRKREVMCEDGSCKIESAGKWNKISVWLATVVAVLALAFPYFNIASTQITNDTVVPDARIVLQIDGMDCRACAAGLRATLARLEGVHKATVDYEKGQGVIEYNPATVQPGDFINQIDEAGFKAVVVESKSVTPSETQ